MFITTLKENGELAVEKTCESIRAGSDEREGEVRLFDPPLYKQRYLAVAKVINDHSAKSVIDMGCSEGQFLPIVKGICDTVEEIVGIDIDLQILELNTNRLRPLTMEYILKRPRPLRMSTYHGSIANPDLRFRGFDCITCIEVVEHLYDNVLSKVPKSLFGLLRPKLVVITTPNCEYNILFKNFKGMRHTDHKFEWTRNEFKRWCEKIVDNYDYDVTISGVGDPPVGSTVGFCSQMAVFILKQEHDSSSQKRFNDDVSKNDIILFPEKQNNVDNVEIKSERKAETTKVEYILVKEFVYPYDDINENKMEKLLNEIDYVINQYFCDVTEESEEIFIRKIPIEDLLSYPGIKKFTNITRNECLKAISDKYSVSIDKKDIMLTIKLSDYMDKPWSDEENVYDDTETFINVSSTCDSITEENWD